MTKTCLQYHQETSYDRNRMGGHYLDWANQPGVFKTYEGIEPVGLPREKDFPRHRLSSLLLERAPEGLSREIDLETLSTLLTLTNTLTARARSQEGDFYFRSAASAGALYPTEIYASTHCVKGLADGLYHFAIHSHGLVPIRNGFFRAAVLEAAGAVDKAPPAVVVFLTAIFFRSAWKYRARAYRYHLMDTGHVQENLVLALKALGLSYHVSYDFDDEQVNRLLGLDESREVALALVLLKGTGTAATVGSVEINELPEPILKASRVSAREMEYPLVREMHDSGKKKAPGKGVAGDLFRALGIRPRKWKPIETPSGWGGAEDYPGCVLGRRSKRNFVREAISRDHMSGLLEALCASDRNDYEGSLCVGYLSENVEGVEAGFHLLDRESKTTGMIMSGYLTEEMARICLDQAWLKNAGAHFLFLANLEMLDRGWGPRGYRYAMMTAGRLGQRLYLAATAMGLGCCSIGAFYDGEAKELLGLNDSSRLLYLVAVGTVRKTSKE